MIFQLHFNDEEITRFFQDNGFQVAPHKTGKFQAAYHNRSEWVEYDVPGVVIDGKTYDATTVFNKVAEARMKRMVAPANLETKRMIERTIKKMKA